MSNVSLTEIIELTSAAFGVKPEALSKHYRGRQGKMPPLGLMARGAAVLLARKHTSVTLRQIAIELGWEPKSSVGDRFRHNAMKIEQLAKRDWVIQASIDVIEERIDELHEKRLAAMEAAAARGFGAFATPPKTPRRRGSKRRVEEPASLPAAPKKGRGNGKAKKKTGSPRAGRRGDLEVRDSPKRKKGKASRKAQDKARSTKKATAKKKGQDHDKASGRCKRTEELPFAA